MSATITHTGIILARELRPTLHNPFSVVFTLVQPLVFLVFFGPLLADVPGVGTAGALQWFVPGILVMSTLFGTSTTGANLLQEMQTGSHERLLVAPLRRPALLLGRAFKEMVTICAQACVLVLAVVPFGFELHPAGALLGLLLLAVFSAGMGSLSYALALAVKSSDWMFWAIQQTLLFPLLLLAGMLLPLDNAPGWLQAASRLNPLRYVVDAERALFGGVIADPAVLAGAVAAMIVAAVGLTVGTRGMKKA